MKTTLTLIAGLALGTALLPQHALADCAPCAIEQPDTPAIPQTPGDCTSYALPTPPALKLANCGGCAIEQPDTPALPQTPEDCTGLCR
jgi:hypothetical protein